MSVISLRQQVRRVRRRGSLPLLTSSALVALVAGASSAHGQAAFQGTPSFSGGNVSYTAVGNNTDVFTINSHSAIIDWTPSDNRGTGTINFLPAGKTGVFQSSTDANFTVLNRINPADTGRPVELDGHVISQFVTVTGASSTATVGGNVWFYTPGGIIVGATGVFDVGSLILTTNAIDTTNGLPSPGGGIKFKGASGSVSNITIRPGGTINAINPGSYVALVAPRISQGGTVNVNGSVGYVAAEAADITINAGLFSIANTIGSQVAPGGETTLTHSGTTTGAAASATGSPHNIYMVAIPKNDAVTMLVSGNVGYQAASSANVVNGTVVLDAGLVSNPPANTIIDPTMINDGGFIDGVPHGGGVTAAGGGQASTIAVGAGTYSSRLIVNSNGNLTVSSAAGDITAGNLTASADTNLSLIADGNHKIAAGAISLFGLLAGGTAGNTTVNVGAGSMLTAAGLRVDVSRNGAGVTAGSATMTVSGTATLGGLALLSDVEGSGNGATIQAGASALIVDGGTLTVTGASLPSSGIATLISSRATDTSFDPNGSGQVFGGAASVTVLNGGTATLGKTALQATASNFDNGGGASKGGIASITASTGGVASFTGDTLTLDSRGMIGAPGAPAQGGTARIVADGGVVKLSDPTTAVSLYAGAEGSAATGGNASLAAKNDGSVNIAGSVAVDASATNEPGAAAPATGGTAAIAADTGGTIVIGRAATVSALADASLVSANREPSKHDAIGGTASVTSANGAAVTFGTQLMLSADATGAQAATVTTGSATAGTVTIQAFGGAITMPSFYAEAIARANPAATDTTTVAQGGTGLVEARGGSITLTDAHANSSIELGARGGIATGGVANLRARLGGTISVAGGMALHTDAEGGTRTDAGALGYAGTGGSASVTANGGTLNLAGLDVSANGYGGDGVASGGNGLGGYTVLQAGPGGTIHNTGATYLNTNGQGGAGGTGAANGSGGTSAVYANGSTITLDDALGVMSTGTGGAALAIGRDPAAQGIGQGGTSSLAADGGGTITLTGATVDATGLGGVGAGGGAGGTGIGGTATFETGRDGQAGNITAQLLYVRSEGTGGASDATAGGDGGLGKGGLAQFSVGTGTVKATTLLVESTGTGADGLLEFNRVSGPSGGDAVGGGAIVSVLGGTLSVQGGEIFTGAIAGDGAAGEYGGSGGDASGGTARMQIAGGTLSGGDWSVFETAQGGAGASGSAGSGGNGGRADAGSVALTISGGSAPIASLSADLTAIGGAGGSGSSVPHNSFEVRDGQPGGSGGAATTGAASLTSGAGSFATSGNLTLANIALGGAGGHGGSGLNLSTTSGLGPGGVGGQGGSATAGSVGLVALGGTITSPRPSLTTNAVAGVGGAGGVGGTGFVASGATGSATGGTATIETDNQGRLALGDTSIDASTLNATTGTGGTVNVQALASGGTAPATAITMTSLTVTNNGPSNGTGGGQTMVQAAAPIAVTGNASFSGTGALSIDNLRVAGSVSASGGSVSIDTPVALTLTSATSSHGDVTIDAAGALDLTHTTLSASGGGISLTSGGGIGFATMTADGDITVRAAGALTGASQISHAGTIDDGATGLIDIATLSAGYAITVESGATGHFATLTAGTETTSNDGTRDFGSIGLRTAGDLVIDTNATATGSIGLLSATGKITAPTLTAGGSAGGIAALAAGPIALDTVTAPGLFYVGGPAAVASLGPDPSASQIFTLLGTAGASPSGAGVTIGATRVGAATIAAGTTLALTGSFATTSGNATLSAAGNVTASDLTSFGGFAATSTGGTVALGTITAGNPTSGGGITLTGTNGVTAANLTGAGSIAASASAGGVTLAQVTSNGGTARITASGAIVTGDVTAAGSIYLTGGAAITAGNLRAGVGTLRAGEGGGGSGGGTDAAPDGIATGFNQNTVGACDDCSTSTIALPFDVNYFGNDYSNTYVSNNGYFTFNTGQGTYTPSGLGTGYSGQAIIAAFFADVDTRGAGTVTYGNGTFAGRQAFGATWNGVGYYGAHSDKLNTFQIVLTNRADTGTGNFDIYYNYGNIGWETGDASGGSGGFGGVPAAVGFNAGTGNQAGTFFQLPGSLASGSFTNGGIAPLITTTNDGNPGQLLFSVRNGLIVVGGPSEPPTVHVSNIAVGNTADIHLGDISGEAAEVHGAGHVTVGNVTVTDQHSGIAATGNPFATVLDASNGLIAGDISGAGFVAIGAAQGDISTGTIASGSSVAVLDDGTIALGAVTTGQTATDTLFVAGNGAKANLTGFDYTTLISGKTFDPTTLASASTTTTSEPPGYYLPISSPGTATVTIGGPVSAGNINIGAARLTTAALTTTNAIGLNGGDITIAGPATAGTTFGASGGNLVFQGTVDAADIAISPGTLAFDGALGSARTASVSITGYGMFIGDGDGGSNGLHISAAELANVHAAAISFTSLSQYNPQALIQVPITSDITIGNLTLTGSNGLPGGALANLTGDNGNVSFNASGNIQVAGHLDLTNLGTGNQVSLNAVHAITGTLPAAGISLTDAGAGLAGTLNLRADTIEFDTAATATAVAAAATLKDRSDALAISDGATTPGSYIQAGGVKFTVGTALYTQNGGPASSRRDDRAGVTAGAGGISLASLGSGPVAVVLNARLTGATGDVTGQDVVGEIQLGGGETTFSYAPLSTVNGCLTDGTPCTPPVEVIEQQIQPVQDVVLQVALPSGIGQSSSYAFQNPQLISMTGLAPATLAPLIDEPVTGAGNDNLWVGVGVSADQPLAPMGGAKSGKKPPPK